MGEVVSEDILTLASRYPRPTFADVLRAKEVIARYLPRTPLHHYASLSEMLGSEIYIKHENHQPVGAFKVRGGVNLFANMSEEEIYKARRNLAELGIGTNPNAKEPDNVLEAEKIKGTVHLAIGDNSHMGGTVIADLHQDFIIPEPDLLLDDKLVIEGGEWRI